MICKISIMKIKSLLFFLLETIYFIFEMLFIYLLKRKTIKKIFKDFCVKNFLFCTPLIFFLQNEF